MAESARPFGILAVLFLASGIPFSGKIVFFNESPSSQGHFVMRNGSIKSGNSTISVSSRPARHWGRIEKEGYDHGLSFSGGYLDRPAFSEDESDPFAKRHEENGENSFQTADASSFQGFLSNMIASQAAAGFENVAQTEEIPSFELPIAEAPQTSSFQASPKSTSTKDRQKSLLPSIAVPFQAEDNTVMRGEFSLPSAEETSQGFVPSFGEWNGDGKFATGAVLNSVSLSHTARSCVLVAPSAFEDFQYLMPMNFSSVSSGGAVFFSQKKVAETEILSGRLFRRSSNPIAGKIRRSLSIPSRLSDLEGSYSFERF